MDWVHSTKRKSYKSGDKGKDKGEEVENKKKGNVGGIIGKFI